MAREETTGWAAKVFPFTRWVPKYQSKWLGPDTIAGLTVWALIVPESIAYASIAGVPVQFGLYAVPLAVLGYALFGTSRRLFVGPGWFVGCSQSCLYGTNRTL